MPGMNSGLDNTNPLVVAAFRTALLHQGLIALLITMVAGAAWVSTIGNARIGLAAGT